MISPGVGYANRPPKRCVCVCVCVEPRLRDSLPLFLCLPILLLCFKTTIGEEECGHLVVLQQGS